VRYAKKLEIKSTGNEDAKQSGQETMQTKRQEKEEDVGMLFEPKECIQSGGGILVHFQLLSQVELEDQTCTVEGKSTRDHEERRKRKEKREEIETRVKYSGMNQQKREGNSRMGGERREWERGRMTRKERKHLRTL
jgi:hypothetical protein